MKLIHLSDLHLGKKVNEFSMIEDQKYILLEILKIIKEEKIEAVIIAGDVYDKPIPPIEAIELFENFLLDLAKLKKQVYIISGNHDSSERLSFGSSFFKESKIYFSSVFNGKITKITQKDEYGDVNIYLLPFLKPQQVLKYYENEKIENYTDACRVIIDDLKIDKNSRNIMVAHQFITGAITSDSENISVGGSDNVDVNIFYDFDYVALGHLHRPQKIKKETIRYSGTPLKYSFSEANHKNTLPIINLNEKGNVEIEFIELNPLRDLVEIKGKYELLTSKKYLDNLKLDNYYHITLLDEDDIPDVVGKLRVYYPNVMKVDYDNKRTRMDNNFEEIQNIEKKSPLELFKEFYELQNNIELDVQKEEYLKRIIEDIWEE